MNVPVTVTALRVFLAVRWQVLGNQEVPLDIARLMRNTGLSEETIHNCLTDHRLYIDGVMIRTVKDGESRYRQARRKSRFLAREAWNAPGFNSTPSIKRLAEAWPRASPLSLSNF